MEEPVRAGHAMLAEEAKDLKASTAIDSYTPLNLSG
jgi:hypothetical protein